MGGRRRRRLPRDPVEVGVRSLSHEGRGVASIDGKTVFVQGALPGERVRFRYTRCCRRFDEGVAVDVLQASPDRVEPPCAAYAVCGGCSLQHLDPERQLATKQASLLDLLRHVGPVEPEAVLPPLRGPLLGYRRRARLAVRKVEAKGRVLVGFRERSSPYVADMHACEVLDPRFGRLLDPLSELIGTLSVADAIPQIELAAGDDRAALVIRHLRPLTDADRSRLVAWGRERDLALFLQPGDPWSLEPLDGAAPDLVTEVDGFRFRFGPTDFVQVNAELNRSMVAHVLALLAPEAEETVLDLFCGSGNFSLPLSRRAGLVIGVEGEAALVQRARSNAGDNGVANVRFHQADLADQPDADRWTDGRAIDRILLDPPRSGAEAVLAELARLEPKRVVYVSCNPSTLARDAGTLVHQHGFRLRHAGVMDMFPHTAHVESVAVFER